MVSEGNKIFGWAPLTILSLFEAEVDGAFGPPFSAPLMRVGRGVWGEGRGLRPLALPPQPFLTPSPLQPFALGLEEQIADLSDGPSPPRCWGDPVGRR